MGFSREKCSQLTWSSHSVLALATLMYPAMFIGSSIRLSKNASVPGNNMAEPTKTVTACEYENLKF